MKVISYLEQLHGLLLVEKTRERIEKTILALAIVSFMVHLAVFYLVDFGFLKLSVGSELLSNPIAAIYTPFSFILLYEVYLLIYYLPKSFTTYIGKQYEIISLIIIRRLFKDLANLDLQGDWFKTKYDLQFTYDLLTSIVVFALIYVFYRQSKSESLQKSGQAVKASALLQFIRLKKGIALLLLPIFVALTLYSFASWAGGMSQPGDAVAASFNNINNIFFEQFFNILIFADVLVLLFSFFLTDEFHKVIRNSGFIISTILIRLSFSASGLSNNVLVVSSIVFGILMLVIHNRFQQGAMATKAPSES